MNFGRNDTKYIMRHPEYYRCIEEATRRMDKGEGIRLSLDEVRSRLGLADGYPAGDR